jgi:hypothetical protein
MLKQWEYDQLQAELSELRKMAESLQAIFESRMFRISVFRGRERHGRLEIGDDPVYCVERIPPNELRDTDGQWGLRQKGLPGWVDAGDLPEMVASAAGMAMDSHVRRLLAAEGETGETA